MATIRHPAHPDNGISLWSVIARDGDGSDNDGGNTDEDPDTFSTGFSDSFSAAMDRMVSPYSQQVAISAVTPGVFGGLIGLMGEARAAAEEAGFSTADPTTNSQESRNGNAAVYSALLRDIQSGLTSDLVLADDFTKRIDNPENYAQRRLLAELYNHSLANSGGGGELGDYRNGFSGGEPALILEQMFGQQPSGLGDDDWDWNQPNNAFRFLAQQLSDEDFAPYEVVDRDFGALKGVNQALADKYRDFTGDFKGGTFSRFAETAGIGAEVDAFVDDWFGQNDDLNKEIAKKFDIKSKFGDGNLWKEVDERGIDRAAVQDFIDRTQGTGAYANPFDGTVTTLPTAVDDTGYVRGSGDLPPGNVFDGGGTSTFTPADFASAFSDVFSQFTFDLPDLSALQPPQVSLGASKEEEDRANLASMRFDLLNSLQRRRMGSSSDVSSVGLVF